MFRLRLAFILAASCSAAFGSTIVIPFGNTNTVGNDTDSNDNNSGSGDLRFQELLGSGQFGSVGGALLIDQISFRAAPGTGPTSVTVSMLNLFLSTSSKFPNGTPPGLMSTTFADNVGADNKLVYSGSVVLSSPGCAGPTACPFDMPITFTTPFLYNPTQGRLLLDFKITGLTGGGGAFDAVSFSAPGGGVAGLAGGLNDAAADGVQLGGDILQLRYTLVATPEPASWTLMLGGAAALGWIRRRRGKAL